jgi:serine/threonine-protein kinase
VRSVAVLLSLATAATIWAVLVSVTPRVLAPEDVPPLTMVAPQRLPDGRLVSLARFETLPILGAAAMIAVALAGYGLLRHHWRRNGLDRRESTGAVDPRWVVGIGAMLMSIYLIGKPVEPLGFRLSLYVPVLAGILEFFVVFLFWDAALECVRTSRPIGRQTGLWLGVTLAVLPPTLEFFTYVATWSP